MSDVRTVGEDAALLRVRAALDRTPDHGCAGVLLIDGHDGEAIVKLLERLEEGERQRGTQVISGYFRSGFARPLGGLLPVVEELVRLTADEQPELVRNQARLLVTLLPGLRGHPALERAVPLRPALADWALRRRGAGVQKFFSRYDLSAWTAAELVHVVLDTATALSERQGTPVLLCLEDLHLADLLTLRIVGLLGLYAASRPLAICASVRETSQTPAKLGSLLAGWQRVELPGDIRERVLADELRGLLGGEQLAAAEAASVLVSPFERETWARLLPERERLQISELAAGLVELGVLRRVSGDRLAFTSARLCEGLYRGLGDRRRSLHAAALASREAEEPFAAAWHARGAGKLDALGLHAREAMLQGWAVAAFEAALAVAGDALGSEAIDGEGALLAGLLSYEAHRHAEAERWLTAAADCPPTGISRTTIRQLLGHNAIFGLGDVERGRTLLSSILADLEARGDCRAAGYVRNSIAFTFFQERDFEAAIRLEESSIIQAGDADVRDDFLLTFLQLNLGRLYRTIGCFEQAVRRLREVLRLPAAELTPSLLLIAHGTLAHLYSSRDLWEEQLAALHHCLQLIQGAEIEAVDERALLAISRAVGAPPTDRALPGDQLLLSLHLGLASSCRRLGLTQPAQAYLAGARSAGRTLDEESWRAAEEVLAAAGERSMAGRPEPGLPVLEAGPALARSARHFRHLGSGPEAVALAAEALADGTILAVLQPLRLGPRVRLLDSLVLFDPRRPALARRVCPELVGLEDSEVSEVRSAVALPEALCLFEDGVEPAPLAVQQTSLRRTARPGLAALTPLRLRLRVLSPELDGRLFELLQGFARRTGVGILASLPFRPWNRDLVDRPECAVGSWLISSIDLLLLHDRLVGKTLDSCEALLACRPRLSRRARISAGGDGADLIVHLRAQRRGPGRVLKLRPQARQLLELIDGRQTVAEIIERMEGGGSQRRPHFDRRLCGFLQRLWSEGVVCLDDASVMSGEA